MLTNRFIIVLVMVMTSTASFSQIKKPTPIDTKVTEIEKRIDKLANTDTVLIKKNSDINREILELKSDFDDLEKKHDSLMAVVNNNQTMQSTLIAIFGIGFTVITVAVTIIIAFLTRTFNRQAKYVKKFAVLIEQNIDGLQDKLQKREALELLDRIMTSPGDFEPVYARLAILNIPSSEYSKFKKLLHYADRLSKDNPVVDPVGHSLGPVYRNFLDETLPLLMKHFLAEIFRDKEVLPYIKNTAFFLKLSEYHRKRCIETLIQVVNESGIEKNLITIEAVIIQMLHYDPSLLEYFTKTLGPKQLAKLRTLWNATHFKSIDPSLMKDLHKNKIVLEDTKEN
jgi:hypothetical protein